MVIAMSIRMQGFIVFDYIKEYAQARQDLAKWLEEGKIKRGETIVKGGLNVIEQTLVDLFNGVNKGESAHLLLPSESQLPLLTCCV